MSIFWVIADREYKFSRMISKDCISIRRKQIRNITARLLKEDELVEPRLQQVTGETLHSDVRWHFLM